MEASQQGECTYMEKEDNMIKAKKFEANALDGRF